MNIRFVDERYRAYSGASSDVARKMAYALLGVYWLLTNKGMHDPPTALKVALFLVMLFFLIDILQYYLASLIWFFFFEKIESFSTVNTKDEFKAPDDINRCATILYQLKQLVLISAMVITIVHLVNFSASVILLLIAILLTILVIVVILCVEIFFSIKGYELIELQDKGRQKEL